MRTFWQRKKSTKGKPNSPDVNQTLKVMCDDVKKTSNEILEFLNENDAALKQDNNRRYVAIATIIKSGRPKLVKDLIATDAYKDTFTEDINTLLRIAATNGCTQTYETLQQAFPETKEDFEQMMGHLDVASKGKHEKLRSYLCKNIKTDLGETLLYLAAKQGKLDGLDNLLKDSLANIETAANDGSTPLYIAAQNGHLEVVIALLQAGADINQPANDGKTPLYIAAENGHLDMVQALLAAGADINQAANDGKTPLSIAKENKHVYIAISIESYCSDSIDDLITALTEQPRSSIKNLRDNFICAYNQIGDEKDRKRAPSEIDDEIRSILKDAAEDKAYKHIFSEWPQCAESGDYILYEPVIGIGNKLYEHLEYSKKIRAIQDEFNQKFFGFILTEKSQMIHDPNSKPPYTLKELHDYSQELNQNHYGTSYDEKWPISDPNFKPIYSPEAHRKINDCIKKFDDIYLKKTLRDIKGKSLTLKEIILIKYRDLTAAIAQNALKLQDTTKTIRRYEGLITVITTKKVATDVKPTQATALNFFSSVEDEQEVQLRRELYLKALNT